MEWTRGGAERVAARSLALLVSNWREVDHAPGLPESGDVHDAREAGVSAEVGEEEVGDPVELDVEAEEDLVEVGLEGPAHTRRAAARDLGLRGIYCLSLLRSMISRRAYCARRVCPRGRRPTTICCPFLGLFCSKTRTLRASPRRLESPERSVSESHELVKVSSPR
ncbi:hypothetical protein GSI_11236 [Ganoderma sinense ZZ0214-1]|uniref:Uncharacterized protein n=1 Tax=Ganoderma sinense ZZ0214-1 TaxID=1077348 RepID=A0A2G8RYR6_9APHY|nr:hypothetical protein GSI_11236 [Ganoderma sinense ZZ0214-1]